MHFKYSGFAPALVGAQGQKIPAIPATGERFGECTHVGQAEVQPLAGQRVDDVGGIARQGQARGDQAGRAQVFERKGSRLAGRAESAQQLTAGLRRRGGQRGAVERE
jgi:hypothetical protein